MRQVLGMVIGLVVGVVGAVMFMQSQPPAEGSAEEKVLILEKKLRQYDRVEKALAEGRVPRGGARASDGLRLMVENMRAGEEVNVDDFFLTMKPLMRDLAPLFEMMRQRDERKAFEKKAGELAQKYGLSQKDKEELKEWMTARADANAEQYWKVIHDDESGMVEMIQAAEELGDAMDGLDEFMEKRLSGEELARYREDRLDERYKLVEEEAHRRFNRLDEVVKLDEAQEDRVFDILVRGSEDYVPEMEFDGRGEDRGGLDREERQAAIREVLTAGQLRQLEEAIEARRQEGLEDLRSLGLSPPENWDELEMDDF